jgi:predicted dehydrogenase
MNILVVGLGSMGKRRIRCLRALDIPADQIHGFDLRDDRRQEAADRYGIPAHEDFDRAVASAEPDALFISVPPHVHHIYIDEALSRRIPFFVEASVVDDGMDDFVRRAHQADIPAVPSATMLFHPAIKTIQEVLNADALGTISNVLLHAGQYLPDWHTYEAVEDFYVSRRETGGAREIVPFELTWLTHLFGFPGRVTGVRAQTIQIAGAEEIDDTYNFILDYDSFLVSGVVDVVSRTATRRVLINGEDGQLVWDWTDETVRVYDPVAGTWTDHPYQLDAAAEGYDDKIGETMYIDEVRAFLNTVRGDGRFPNSLEEDWRVLKLLYSIEDASDTGTFVHVSSPQTAKMA